MEWHYELHHRFAEQLVYYLLRVRPFEAQRVSDSLNALLARSELQSVRVFKLIGPNDLLIRAWHHSNVTPNFPDWLREALVFGTEVRRFVVANVHMISSFAPALEQPEAADLLESLYDEETVQAVQDGHDDNLLDQLIKTGVVITRDSQGPDAVKFFLAISLSQKDETIQVDAAKDLCRHIRDNATTIKNASVYRGDGFCDIFVKGETDNLFNVGSLIDWIYVRFQKYSASTETYVVAWPRPLIEAPDRISESTFKAVHGKDPFVHSIIPELYERFYSSRKDIEGALSRTRKQVIAAHKKLIHEFLLAYLEGKNIEIGRVLFTFFTELEEYFRENHREFIGRNSLSPGKVYDAVGMPQDSRKYINLGHLFNIFAYIVKEKALSDDVLLAGDWNSLVELRNKPLHGALNYSEEWRASLETLLQYLPRLRRLIEVIYDCTSKEYNFTYLPNATQGHSQ
jgi:hypothetical protein